MVPEVPIRNLLKAPIRHTYSLSLLHQNETCKHLGALAARKAKVRGYINGVTGQMMPTAQAIEP